MPNNSGVILAVFVGLVIIINIICAIQNKVGDKFIILDEGGYKYTENLMRESTFYIINKKGEILMKSNAIQMYDDIILYKKENKNMVMLDTNLKEISKEYDKIIVNGDIDIIVDLASYYP